MEPVVAFVSLLWVGLIHCGPGPSGPGPGAAPGAGPRGPCPEGQFSLKGQCVLCHPSCSGCHGHELFQCTGCGVDEDGHERFLHQGRCRTHCPRGFYSSRGRYACLPCGAHCELCSDASVCAKCQEPYKLQGGICRAADCTSGQVQDPDTAECIRCGMGCKACSTENPEMCSSCLEGHFLFRHQCRSHCPQSSFQDRGRGVCLPCPAPCTDCRSSTHCLACQDGHFLHDTQCVKQCPPQTFRDASGGRCPPCHSSCQACHGPRATHCDSCAGGASPVRGQCPLVTCPPGQYLDGKYGECHACDPSCRTCFGPQALDCSTCFTGYFLDQDSSCVQKCPVGSFSNAASQLCDDCSPNCESCTESSDRCTGCSGGSDAPFLHQGRCWSTCPEGFLEAEGSCQACHASCLTCDGSRTQCLSCTEGLFLEGGACGTNCSLRTFPGDDGTCRRCPPHCDVCSDERTCFKCSFLYLILDGVCRASCPLGFFEDMEEGRCGPCHASCGGCSGPGADDCEACSASTPKLYEGVCYLDCPAGTYYEAAAMECQECHRTCSRCSGPEASQCSQCERGLVLDPNTLLCGVTGDTDCPLRTFLHQDQFTCVACHRLCRSCGGPGHDRCQTCSVPKYLHNSTCVSACPPGTFASTQDAGGAELGFCSPCAHACSTCTGASPRDCLACSPGYLRLLPLCLSHCPTGYYAVGSRCERCDPSCERCSGPGPRSCRVCSPPLLELLGSGRCVERCPQRFFQSQDRCRRCHTSCRTCADASPQGCVTCDPGATLKDNVCYPRCEEGRYYAEEQNCEPCHSSCKHCTGPGPDRCLTCPPDSALRAEESRCAVCCRAGGNDSDCCVCDAGSALCVEAPRPKAGDDRAEGLDLSSGPPRPGAAALPVALLLALGAALAVFALVKARAKKMLCWGHSYERLSGSAGTAMPHGVPEPDSGDEADVVYTSRGASVYRRYSFILEQDAKAGPDVSEGTQLHTAT